MTESLPPPAFARHADGIDALRGIAALLVVLFHMNQSGFGVVSPAWTQAGLLGVHLFFTLSGFLIARCVMAPAQFGAKRYLENRARRWCCGRSGGSASKDLRSIPPNSKAARSAAG